MTRRPWAWPLWPLNAVASSIKNVLYNRNILRPESLAYPVISIGSLSAGGAGKTPAVIALTRLLQNAGWRIDVLSRGYGRSTKGVRQVDPAVPNAATLYGDEPVLIARATQAPVWVAPQRHTAGLAAEAFCRGGASAPPEGTLNDGGFSRGGTLNPAIPALATAAPRALHLLDDGFQHRQLARNLDIVLLTAEDFADQLLPVGNLRDPLSALHRADILILRAEEKEILQPRLHSLGFAHKPCWPITRTLRFPTPLGVLGAGLRPLAFCAIARPENFEAMLRAAGCGVLDTLAFRDHHAYTPQDIAHILDTARKLNASGFLTTEKDAVKLNPELRAHLETLGPLAIVSLDAIFEDESAVLRDLEARLR